MRQVAIVPGTFCGMHADEIQLFQRFLTGLKGLGVEVGCCDGFSTAHILAITDLHLTSIDPFVPDSMVSTLLGSEERFRANTAAFADRCTLIKSTSEVEVGRWPSALDFVYIDGDHNYEAAKHDVLQWQKHLRQGGFLAMHDSRMGRPGGAPFHPGPTQVAAELIYGQPDQWELLGEAWAMTLARKR